MGVASNLDRVVNKVRSLADETIDVGAVLGGIFLPGTISDRVAAAYDKHLFHGATLQDLPDERPGETPRFIIHATNVQTAALWRFAKTSMGDYRVGLVRSPTVKLAKAVAASSAFPPVLSPLELEIDQPVEAVEGADLSRPPFTKRAVLSDGGVYDNLGLETVFKRFTTVLVSDAGGKTEPEEEPDDDWARHSIRILNVSTTRCAACASAIWWTHTRADSGRGPIGGCARITPTTSCPRTHWAAPAGTRAVSLPFPRGSRRCRASSRSS